MTAEQLEELLGKDTDPACENCGRDDTLLISLARSVVAAEKLVEALDAIKWHKVVGFAGTEDKRSLDAAISAYREASK